MTMKYQEQLESIIYAILEARKRASKGQYVRLRQTENSELSKIEKDDLSEILYKLQTDFEVIKVVEAPGGRIGFTKHGAKFTENVLSDDYLLTLRASFDEWVADFLRHRRNAIDKISWNSFLHVFDVLQDINNHTQLTNKDRVVFRLLKNPISHRELFPGDTPTMRSNYMKKREDALKYLKNQNVIHDYGHVQDAGWDTDVWVDINLIEFHQFYQTAHKLYLYRTRNDNEKPSSNDEKQSKQDNKSGETRTEEIAYEITYNEITREIKISGFKLSQPHYDSDNEKFIAYMLEHPNEPHEIEKLKTKLKLAEHWDINKALESLGFTKDYRQAFFSVGSGKVELRNPLTQSEVADNGIQLSLRR